MNAINTAIDAPVISIASSAYLSDLAISVWSASKKDKGASEEVTQNKHAKRGVANVNKKLLQCDSLIAIQKFAANARNAHYQMTLPWADCGLRLLTQAKYQDYDAAMAKLQAEFYSLVEHFIADYTWEVQEAEAALGDLFNKDDYPAAHRLRDKFRFSLTYFPVSDHSDFRVANGIEAAERYKHFYQRALNNAMHSVWERCAKALSNMSERLDYSDTDTKKIFRDSLVENALEIVELMRDCNITNDPVMEEQRSRLERALRHVGADDLRKSAPLRASVKKSVDDVLASIPSLDM